MNYTDWRNERFAIEKKLEDMKAAVVKKFYVPAVYGGPMWAEVRTYIDDDRTSLDCVVVGVFWINSKKEVLPSEMDEPVIKAFQCVQREVSLWKFGERDEFPTAEELELVDGDNFKGLR